VPTFAVEPGWPKVPAQWKLGDVSSIAIDAQGDAWVLHRPRTLKPQDAAMAAPPVLELDPAGNFIKAWGGPGSGYEWVEREHGIYVDGKGFVWIGGNNCPGLKLPGLKPVADDQLLKFTQDGKFVMQIGHSNQSKGNATPETCIARPTPGFIRRPTSCSWPTATAITGHRVRRRYRRVQAHVGRLRQPAGGRRPLPGCPQAGSQGSARYVEFQHRAFAARRQRRHGLCGRRENRRVQTFTSDGKFVKQFVKTATPFARNVALSPDPEQQYLYVGDDKSIDILDRKTLDLVGSVEGRTCSAAAT